MRTPLSRVLHLRALEEEAERLACDLCALELNKLRGLQQRLQADARDRNSLAHFARMEGDHDAGRALALEADAALGRVRALSRDEQELVRTLERQTLIHSQSKLRLRQAEILQRSEAERIREQQGRKEQAQLDEWFLLRSDRRSENWAD